MIKLKKDICSKGKKGDYILVKNQNKPGLFLSQNLYIFNKTQKQELKSVSF